MEDDIEVITIPDTSKEEGELTDEEEVILNASNKSSYFDSGNSDVEILETSPLKQAKQNSKISEPSKPYEPSSAVLDFVPPLPPPLPVSEPPSPPIPPPLALPQGNATPPPILVQTNATLPPIVVQPSFTFNQLSAVEKFNKFEKLMGNQSPAWDIEDPDYIDLLLEYKEIQQKLEDIKEQEVKVSEAAEKGRKTTTSSNAVNAEGESTIEETPAKVTRKVSEDGEVSEKTESDGVKSPAVDSQQDDDEEDLDLLELRLAALKSTYNKAQEREKSVQTKEKSTSPKKNEQQRKRKSSGLKQNRANSSSDSRKRSRQQSPFSRRNSIRSSVSSHPTAKKRRSQHSEEERKLRQKEEKLVEEAQRLKREEERIKRERERLRKLEDNLRDSEKRAFERREQDRREKERRERRENVRREEKREMEKRDKRESEKRNKGRGMQKILTLDDPEEQYKKFLEYMDMDQDSSPTKVSSRRRSQRTSSPSRKQNAKPEEGSDNYEEVEMDLDDSSEAGSPDISMEGENFVIPPGLDLLAPPPPPPKTPPPLPPDDPPVMIPGLDFLDPWEPPGNPYPPAQYPFGPFSHQDDPYTVPPMSGQDPAIIPGLDFYHQPNDGIPYTGDGYGERPPPGMDGVLPGYIGPDPLSQGHRNDDIVDDIPFYEPANTNQKLGNSDPQQEILKKLRSLRNEAAKDESLNRVSQFKPVDSGIAEDRVTVKVKEDEWKFKVDEKLKDRFVKSDVEVKTEKNSREKNEIRIAPEENRSRDHGMKRRSSKDISNELDTRLKKRDADKPEYDLERNKIKIESDLSKEGIEKPGQSNEVQRNSEKPESSNDSLPKTEAAPKLTRSNSRGSFKDSEGSGSERNLDEEEAFLRAQLLRSMERRRKERLEKEAKMKSMESTKESDAPACSPKPVDSPKPTDTPDVTDLTKPTTDSPKPCTDSPTPSTHSPKQSTHSSKPTDTESQQVKSESIDPVSIPSEKEKPETGESTAADKDNQPSIPKKIISRTSSRSGSPALGISTQSKSQSTKKAEAFDRVSDSLSRVASSSSITGKSSPLEVGTSGYPQKKMRIGAPVIPIQAPVIIKLGGSSDSSDSEDDVVVQANDVTSKQVSDDTKTKTAVDFMGQLDSFLKAARASTEQKKPSSSNPVTEPSTALQPSTQQTALKTDLSSESDQAKPTDTRRVVVATSSALPKASIPVNDVDKSGKMLEKKAKEDGLMEEMKKRVKLMEMKVLQEKSFLIHAKSTMKQTQEQLSRRKTMAKSTEMKAQKLREQLAAVERVINANNTEIDKLNQKARQIQTEIDTRRSSIQNIGKQLLLTGRKAHGPAYKPSFVSKTSSSDSAKAPIPEPMASTSSRMVLRKTETLSAQTTTKESSVHSEREKENVPSSNAKDSNVPTTKSVSSVASNNPKYASSKDSKLVRTKDIKSVPPKLTHVVAFKDTKSVASRDTKSVALKETKSIASKDANSVVSEKARLLALSEKYASIIQQYKDKQKSTGPSPSKPKPAELRQARNSPAARKLPSSLSISNSDTGARKFLVHQNKKKPESRVYRKFKESLSITPLKLLKNSNRRSSLKTPEHVRTQDMMTLGNDKGVVSSTQLVKPRSLLSPGTKPNLGYKYLPPPEKKLKRRSSSDSQGGTEEEEIGGILGLARQNNKEKRQPPDNRAITVLQRYYEESVKKMVLKGPSKTELFKIGPHLMFTGARNTQVLLNCDMGAVNKAAEQSSATTSCKIYSSPLVCFKSYRFSPYCRTKEKYKLTCPTVSNKIDPFTPFCRYDLTGKCNDKQCPMQHVDSIAFKGNEVLHDLMSYCPTIAGIQDTTPVTSYTSIIDGFIENVKKLAGNMTVDDMCIYITSKINAHTKRNPPHCIMLEERDWKPFAQRYKPAWSKDVIEAWCPNFDIEKPDKPPLSSQEDTLNDTDVRYYMLEASVQDMERAVHEYPHDVNLWIKLAYKKLHESKGLSNLNVALEVLSRGIESNRKSTDLWHHYLKLYKRKSSAKDDLGVLCGQAFNYCPAPCYEIRVLKLEGNFNYDIVTQQAQVCTSELIKQAKKCPGAIDPVISHRLLVIFTYRIYVKLCSGRLKGWKKILTQKVPEIAVYMTLEDKVSLHLISIHGKLCKKLPDCIFDPSKPGWLVNKKPFLMPVNIEDVRKSLDNMCKDALNSLGKPHTQDEFETIFPLYQNQALAVKSIEASISVLQPYVNRSPKVRLLLAELEESRGHQAAVKRLLWPAVMTQKYSAEVYFAAASYEIHRSHPDQALSFLTESIHKLYVEKEGLPDTTLCFRHILGLEVPLNIQFPAFNHDIMEEDKDGWVYVGLNYCVYLELTGSSHEAVAEAYETGLATLTKLDDIKILWLRYLQYASSDIKTSKDFQRYSDLVNRCHTTVPCKLPIPYTDSYYFDYSFHNSVIDQYLTFVQPDQHMTALQKFLARMPKNFELHRRTCQKAFDEKDWNLCHGLCMIALQEFPQQPVLWKMLLSIAHRQHSMEISQLWKLAVDQCPLDLNLSKNWIMYEQLEGSEESIQEALTTVDKNSLAMSEFQIYIQRLLS